MALSLFLSSFMNGVSRSLNFMGFSIPLSKSLLTYEVQIRCDYNYVLRYIGVTADDVKKLCQKMHLLGAKDLNIPGGRSS
jgi:hypothetical protein